MRSSLFVLCLALFAAALFAPSAEAQTCAECEVILGDWDHLEQYLDFNGNGFSTYDLVVIAKLKLYGGNTVVTPSILTGYAVNGVDVTGDGIYDATDFDIIRQLYFFMNAGGLTSLDLDEFEDCARMYILAICP